MTRRSSLPEQVELAIKHDHTLDVLRFLDHSNQAHRLLTAIFAAIF